MNKSVISNGFPNWLTEWLEAQKVPLWGAADLKDFHTPLDQSGKKYPFAISFVIPMNPKIMASIQKGPNQEYADEYVRVNKHINELSTALAAKILEKNLDIREIYANNFKYISSI
ncbi:hypothetical protein [Desulfobacula sp.]|uniref:hypothetical protein n=1 Tax=Desulfobacula sp. TaxID=2593537 RepID=UPI001DC816C8|nr:hypothetical protein [Desulfobacula sp.]